MTDEHTVGVAIVGYGYWGANLARNVVQADTTALIGIVEPAPPRSAVARRTYPDAACWPTLDAALRDDRVDAVAISTPAATHHDLALLALAEGRHVLVEKPFALTPRDAADIVAAGREANRVVMVGHTFLYSPAVVWLRDYIASGELGKILYVYSQRLSLGRIRSDCSAMWNFAPHDLSIICHLVGEYPTEASGRGFSFLQPGIPDVVFATLSFPSGAAAGIQVSWIDPRKTRTTTIVGDRRMAVYNDVSVDQKIQIFDAGTVAPPGHEAYDTFSEFQWKTREGDITIPRIPFAEPLCEEMTAFGEACLKGTIPLTDGAHGAAIVDVLTAIDASIAAAGAAVRVPPSSEGA